MKASEINECVFEGSMLSHKAEKQHYKDLAKRGALFPTTKQQAMFIALNGYYFDVLGLKDVNEIEEVFKRHGFRGNYIYTKNKNFVRLSIYDNARFLRFIAEDYGFTIPKDKNE